MENNFASYADIRIINGDLRSGKTGPGVGFAIDDLVKIYLDVVTSGEGVMFMALN